MQRVAKVTKVATKEFCFTLNIIFLVLILITFQLLYITIPYENNLGQLIRTVKSNNNCTTINWVNLFEHWAQRTTLLIFSGSKFEIKVEVELISSSTHFGALQINVKLKLGTFDAFTKYVQIRAVLSTKKLYKKSSILLVSLSGNRISHYNV